MASNNPNDDEDLAEFLAATAASTGAASTGAGAASGAAGSDDPQAVAAALHDAGRLQVMFLVLYGVLRLIWPY